MADAIAGLEPRDVWKYFAEISKIPRGSKNEKAVAAYVVKTAREMGYDTVQDRVGNVVVRKPASASKARTRGLILQGHLDMVCEKNADKKHDFLKDPIELVRKGNFLMANGTTLGADNGIAVATNLAIMADRNLEHGPLELLFTIDEETGLTGASNLDPGLLKYTTLLNLDSEEEGSVYVGCSGGKDLNGSWAVETKPAPGQSAPWTLRVDGLRGGHSGLEIDKGRGNAIKILNRLLMALWDPGVRLVSIDGGNKRNAIPRECFALVAVPRKAEKTFRETVARFNDTVRAEFSTVEPDLKVAAEAPEGKGKRRVKVLKKSLQQKLMRTIAALPHGVTKFSADIPGLVETSTNLAVVSTSKKKITIETSQRSSVLSEILEIQESVRSVFELGGAAAEGSNGYPGWKPNLDSPVLKLVKSTYRGLYGKDPEIKAIHAGLECGIIGEKYPGMDMVSFGPTLEGVHSPDEKIHIDTVGKFYRLVLEILRRKD
jgi:dipeptidase D